MAARRTEAGRVARYRILAAEAHSWSSLLLEDERGQRYLFVVGTRALTKLTAGAAGDLLAKRAYRPWRGERSWAPLEQLPILKQPVGVATPPEIAAAFVAEPHQTESQPS